jgi:hypothetical protein
MRVCYLQLPCVLQLLVLRAYGFGVSLSLPLWVDVPWLDAIRLTTQLEVSFLQRTEEIPLTLIREDIEDYPHVYDKK